jgi:hypothetical protein
VSSQSKTEVKGPLAPALQNFQADRASSDGTISLGTNIMNLSGTGTQDSSKYGLRSVVSYEINEIPGLGSSMDAGFAYVSAEAVLRCHGTGSTCAAVSGRSYTTSTSESSCFSINASTGITRFNQSSTGDYGDWFNSGSAKVQDAFGIPGSQANNSTEWQALNVLVYTIVASVVPQPATGALPATALATVGLWRRKKRSA